MLATIATNEADIRDDPQAAAASQSTPTEFAQLLQEFMEEHMIETLEDSNAIEDETD